MSEAEDARPALAASIAIGAGGFATIAGALISEHVFGYVPCMLCLWQRWPYYLGVPVAALLALAIARGAARRLVPTGFALLAVIFAAGAGLGVYHAGVEFGAWPGPASCGGGGGLPASAGNLLERMRTTRVVACDAPALLVLGLSLAAWNALIAASLASAAGYAALRSVRAG